MTADPRAFGVSSMVAPLRRVAMRRPGRALFGADPDLWHYAERPRPERVGPEFDALVRALEGAGVEIAWIPDEDDGLADAIFTFDPSFVTGDGAVLLRPGKVARRPEVPLHRFLFERLRIPILGSIDPPGTVEGGDLCWIDAHTLAAGIGFRTNRAGLDQLRAILGRDVEVVSFDLPVWEGEAACLHLLSLLSPLADDLALVHRPLLPVGLDRLLVERGVARIEAPEDEFAASRGLSVNVLALAPRRVVALDGYPKTTAALRRAGCEVTLVPGEALCLPLEGGPTCLTRPLSREGSEPARHV